MVVVKAIIEVPIYWLYFESFWGNDNWWVNNKNFDLWDAYKWATTDAITKIASYMGIWIEVFKWQSTAPTATPTEVYVMTKKDLDKWEGKIYWKSVYIDWDKKIISQEQITKLKAHDKYVELPPKKK